MILSTGGSSKQTALQCQPLHGLPQPTFHGCLDPPSTPAHTARSLTPLQVDHLHSLLELLVRKEPQLLPEFLPEVLELQVGTHASC